MGDNSNTRNLEVSKVRTARGDIPASELGVCYPHEHVFGAPPAHLATADLVLDSREAALKELQYFKMAGGQALVDMSTMDYNRDARRLRAVSEATGIHIIATTGFNKDKFSKSIVDELSDAQLDALLLNDVNAGMDGTQIRAGVLKASSTLDEISPTARRVFESVARVHQQTGLPISTHTEAGTMAMAQVALLTRRGVSPANLIIGHLDRKLAWPYLLDVAQTGVYLGFDQISKEKYYPDQLRIDTILKLIDHGHGDQILLSGDLARRSYWPSYGGGPGLTYILWRFIPWLREAGVSSGQIDDLLIHNPARALSFTAATPSSPAAAAR